MTDVRNSAYMREVEMVRVVVASTGDTISALTRLLVFRKDRLSGQPPVNYRIVLT